MNKRFVQVVQAAQLRAVPMPKGRKKCGVCAAVLTRCHCKRGTRKR
jgi:hypothetical protein